MARRQIIKETQDKGTMVLAWLSFGFAVVGGTAAAGTFVGDWIELILDAQPWPWLPVVLLVALVITTVIDLFLDLTPNQAALYSVILAPSVARSAPGKLGNKVGEWTNSAMGYVDSSLVDWLGTSSSTGLAIACVAASLLMARRVVRKSVGVPAGVGGRF